MNRFALYILFLTLFLFTSCKEQQIEIDYTQRMKYVENNYLPVQTDTQITCLTYNIQCGFPIDKDPWTIVDISTQSHLDELVDVIQSIDPDIVCLQEVPLNRYNSEVKDVVGYLATQLQMNISYGTHGYNDPTGIWPVHGQWGVATLTKYEIVEADIVEVEYLDVWRRRSILVTELILNGEPIFVYNLHYMWGTPNNLSNTLYLLSQHGTEKQIMMGDFNDEGMNMPEFPAAGYQETYTLSGASMTSIDMIYINPLMFNVWNAEFIIGSDTVSDHHAVYSILKPN